MSACDWGVLTEEVDAIAHRAARRVSAQYPLLEQEDLHQEARIIACSNPAIVREYVEKDQLGFLSNWLWQQLTKGQQSTGRNLEKHVSYERELERYATVES